jgi:hypothetical protein
MAAMARINPEAAAVKAAIEILRTTNPAAANALIAATSRKGRMDGLLSRQQIAQQAGQSPEYLLRLVKNGSIVADVPSTGPGISEAWLPGRVHEVQALIEVDIALNRDNEMIRDYWNNGTEAWVTPRLKIEIGKQAAVHRDVTAVITKLQRLLTRQEAAHHARLSPWILRRWVEAGRVTATIPQNDRPEQWNARDVTRLANCSDLYLLSFLKETVCTKKSEHFTVNNNAAARPDKDRVVVTINWKKQVDRVADTVGAL